MLNEEKGKSKEFNSSFRDARIEERFPRRKQNKLTKRAWQVIMTNRIKQSHTKSKNTHTVPPIPSGFGEDTEEESTDPAKDQ